MVFCIVGLAIFGILGIFSAKYRRYFRESIHCMRRQVMLKPCDSQFDQEMKAKISVSMSKVSPRAARFVFKRFALLSWILLIIMLISAGMVGFGIYNFVIYGNCNGPDSTDFCIFNPFGTGQELKMINTEGAPMLGNPSASVKIIEVGCYSCPYTRDAESVRSQLLLKYGENVSFTFKDIPLPNHNMSWIVAEAAKCAQEQGSYWEFHDKLFEYQDQMSVQKLKDIVIELGLDQNGFDNCLETHKYMDAVQSDYQDGLDAGIRATPTYYVNGKPIVGLKAFAQLERIVVGEIRGSCPG